jgi:NitT/TauT family transport system substrate-binding protein
MRAQRKSVTLVAALAIASLAVAGGASARSDGAQAAVNVRFAVGPDPAYLPFIVAEAKGIFQKYKINPTLKFFSNGGDMNDAAIAGEIDFSASGGGTLLPRLATKRLTLLAVSATSGTTFAMAARSNLQRPADFVGKRLGVVQGTTPEFVWKLFLEKNKIKPTQVQMVYATPPELLSGIVQGRIDAFYCWQPWPFRATELSKDIKIFQYSKDIGYKLYFSLSGNRDYVVRNPGTTVNFLRAMREAIAYINANKNESIELMAKAMRLSGAETRPLVEDYAYALQSPGKAVKDDLLATARWLASQGKLNTRTFPWKTAITPVYVNRVLREGR